MAEAWVRTARGSWLRGSEIVDIAGGEGEQVMVTARPWPNKPIALVAEDHPHRSAIDFAAALPVALAAYAHDDTVHVVRIWARYDDSDDDRDSDGDGGLWRWESAHQGHLDPDGDQAPVP
ncbi:hypothetical protein [Actinomadura sp. 6N118]|uniref:hypothetical protein n=1 Tax=Actinomadura sp. 6N118 TaxID=3375151 RepID=UPI0037BAE00B